MTELMSKEVRHPKFGLGRVSQQSGRYLTVDFDSCASRRFIYPDAFGEFLSFTDPDVQNGAQELIKLEKQACEEQKRQELLESERRRKKKLLCDMAAQRAKKKPASKKTVKA